MIIGIDASNIRGGGGITHLSELLRAVDIAEHGIAQIVVWGGRQTLHQLPRKHGITLVHEPQLDARWPERLWWQTTRLQQLAALHCDLLFVPGGSYVGRFRPFVAMSQNLLPFDSAEARRYGLSRVRLRLALLHRSQRSTFRRAWGVIFLTRYARAVVLRSTPIDIGRTTIIAHGIDERFRLSPRPQLPISAYSAQRPFRLLYISIIDNYKHQWRVAEAVARLRRSGVPVTIDFIGHAYPPALRRLRKVADRADPGREFLRRSAAVPFGELHAQYHRADAFVFASTCETFGQILLEAMASGLPIACARRSALPEVLGEAGEYFDPHEPDSIATALARLIADPERRGELARLAYERAGRYSWAACARETFAYLSAVARQTPVTAKG